MNKFVELLEQHIQWVAISLGGLFFLWVVWAYVITPPVSYEVPIVGVVTPGTVDAEVEKDAKQLHTRINDKTKRIPKQADSNSPFMTFDKLMRGEVPPPTIVRGNSFNSMPITVAKVKDDAPIQEIDKVATLPKVPPSYPLPNVGIKQARALVVAAPPVPAANPPVPADAPQNATDINYIRGDFKIEPEDIAAEFDKVKIPVGQQTMVVEIEVWRQELQVDGTYGQPTLVSPLNNGIKKWPVPKKDAGFQAIGQFDAWFATPQAQADLLRPPFYQVVAGEGPWDQPQNLDNAKAAVAAQGAAAQQAREAEIKAREAARRQNIPQRPESPTERRRSGEPDLQVSDTTRSDRFADLAGLQLAQQVMDEFGNPVDISGRGATVPPDIANMPDQPQPGQPGQPAQVGQPNMPALPQPQFIPKGAPPIFGWYYDVDVKEGHTYRYQVRYALKNPMWQNNQVVDIALANQYAIWSELADNAWSEPRTIETSTRFFIADRSWQRTSVPNTIRIEIFKWTGGKWQNRIFQVGRGDSIGWEEANVQYKSNSTLVDVRFDERLEKAYILVLGPDGHIQERDPLSDRNSADRAALKWLVEQNRLPAGAAGNGPGVAPVAGR